jgi:AAA+ ATPase superfamily predicted ATPase
VAKYKRKNGMRNQIIGRESEIKRLQELYNSGNPEFVALYGRRRVGKTFLVRQMFGDKFVFDLAGLANAKTQEQLVNFNFSLRRASHQHFGLAKNWLEAFEQLISLLKSSKKRRKVIFMDEIPWLDTVRSGFLSALEHFWNGWACNQNDVMLIVCGSATSWIMNNLINNHGGLHNRLTATINLQPFTLHECELYFQSRNIALSRYQMAECYMIMGGIPFYLSKIQKGLSIAQNIDNMFFNPNSELKNEFKNLYASLFKKAGDYISIVEVLGKKSKGLSRSEIVDLTKMKSGGGLSTMLKNLEYCGFIRSYSAFNKRKRDVIYQLLDAYTLFYFKYLEKNKYKDGHFWTNSLNTPQHYTWAGYAFEMLALLHVRQIKKALEIGGVQSAVYAWRSEHSTPAAQIDLIIDRKDGVSNLCEIKFATTQYAITQEYEENLRNKIAVYRAETKTKNAIHLLMLTTFGIAKNKYAGIMQKELILNDLFE